MLSDVHDREDSESDSLACRSDLDVRDDKREHAWSQHVTVTARRSLGISTSFTQSHRLHVDHEKIAPPEVTTGYYEYQISQKETAACPLCCALHDFNTARLFGFRRALAFICWKSACRSYSLLSLQHLSILKSKHGAVKV